MEGYFVKNLKSILKKLTLILLASFLLAGSPKLLAMDTDSDPKDEAISSLILRASRILAGEDVSFFHEAGAQAKECRAGLRVQKIQMIVILIQNLNVLMTNWKKEKLNLF